MATLLEAMGVRVLRCDPKLPAGVALPQLLDESDVVTLHCDLTVTNRGLIGQDEIRRLRRGAVVLNTARGALLDVEAAVASVRAGHLAGLGLDVFPEEPANLERYADPRILVTPHAAGWHPGLGAKIAEGVTTALSALLDGSEIPYRVI
jgi:D-3-phosphoglycerate dehydrogenase